MKDDGFWWAMLILEGITVAVNILVFAFVVWRLT